MATTKVISHAVRPERAEVYVLLEDANGVQRSLHIRIGPQKDPCPGCGRVWPLNADSTVNAAAAIAAQQTDMDAAAAAVAAYAAATGLPITPPSEAQ